MENKKERNEEPVIIRRAVIINDDEEKQEKKSKDVGGHVTTQKPNKNKDYNIVYRDKPSKPLTVSELFGIPKKEKTKPATENQSSQRAVSQENKKQSTTTSVSENKNTATTSTNVVKNNSQTFSNSEKLGKDNNVKSQFNKDKRTGLKTGGNSYSQDKKFERRPKNNGGIDKEIKDIVELEVPTDKENIARDYKTNKLKEEMKIIMILVN